MTTLFIAEKPSVAQDIATVLGITERGRGYFVCGDNTVTSCFGHLFEMAKPEHYDPSLATWSMAALPIVPAEWVALPKEDAKDRVRLIGQFLKNASTVVNAGDPDNEGQLLVDEVLEHFNYRGRVLRYFTNAQDAASVQAGLDNIEDNTHPKYVGMRNAARARSQADWLIGFNLSRAFTLRTRALGGTGVVPVGRVMTPTLAMVAERDNAIASFRPVPFHVVTARLRVAAGELTMRWNPADDHPGLDADGRFIDTQRANELIARLSGATGELTSCELKRRTESQPKGLSLAGIGLLASEQFGFTAAQTLEICQKLYEDHKLTSYPRTDGEYLKESQHAAARDILDALRDNMPQIAPWIDIADADLMSPIWSDAKLVGVAHHAIIPTAARKDLSRLTEAELSMYQLIVRHYIAQFYPAHAYDEQTVHAEVGGERFAAKGKTVIDSGWRQLYQAAEVEEGADDQSLPPMAEGETVEVVSAERHDRRTTPPKRFTEGTLPIAMENIYRYFDDPADRAALKDGEGIGTSATRAPTIEDLKRRNFLANDGKYIVCTQLGHDVLAMLPPPIKSAALTAIFQRQLREIEAGERSVDGFVTGQLEFINSLIAGAAQDLPAEIQCRECGQGHMRRIARKKASDGHFWSCSRWREGCKATAEDNDGVPNFACETGQRSTGPAVACPACADGQLRRMQRRDKTNYFWGCSKYSAGCRFTTTDNDGAPQLSASSAAAPL